MLNKAICIALKLLLWQPNDVGYCTHGETWNGMDRGAVLTGMYQVSRRMRGRDGKENKSRDKRGGQSVADADRRKIWEYFIVRKYFFSG